MKSYARVLHRVVAVLSVAVCLSGVATAQIDLLPSDELAGFTFGGGTFATAEVIAVDGLPFTQAYRISVNEVPPFPYDVQLQSPTIAPVAAGEAVVAVVWIRRADSDRQRGLVDLVFEENADPFERTLTEALTPTSTWRRVAIPLVAFETYDVGAAKYDFQLGYQEQVIEIGGFELLNYGALGVLGTDSVDLFSLADGGIGSGSIVPVDGQLFDRAWRVSVDVQTQNPWDIQLTTTLPAGLSQGETGALVFSYRDVLGNAPRIGAVVEYDGSPYVKSFSGTLTEGADWQRVIVPFEFEGTPPNGLYGIRFQLGQRVQEIEIGGIELINFGGALPAGDLNSSYPYADRSPLAPWRSLAWRRIQRTRQSELRVLVGDANSNPLPGAEVEVSLDRHAFGFGTAIASWRLLSNTPENLLYQDELAEHFNMAVSENFLKWIPWESQPKSSAVDTVDWLVDRGLRIRGHNLVWPSFSLCPADVSGLFGDDLRNRVLDHITEEATYPGIAGRIEDWDVINEAYTNRDIQDRLGGDAVLEDWMIEARAAEPAAQLFVNDFNIVTDGGGSLKEDWYFDLITDWQARGVPIDGIGFQAHFRYGLTSMQTANAIFKRFGDLGLRISITEFDQNILDKNLQADYLEDFMTLAFSHPAVDSFLMWGFWDGAHWLGNAPLYELDWTLKPSGAAWLNLVENVWRTDEAGTTNGAGRYEIDGFHGEYTITARHNGVEKTVQATLEPGGTVVPIRMD